MYNSYDVYCTSVFEVVYRPLGDKYGRYNYC